MRDPSTLTARDVMQARVVAIGPDDSLRDALALITENHVSGLPVVDAKDLCVGVVSVSDILRYEEEETELSEQTGIDEVPFYNPESQRWESIRPHSSAEELPEVAVSAVMSTDLAAVRPDATLAQVAEMMLAEEVHRVLVLDEHQKLLGVVSAIDFVRAFAET